MRLLLVILSVLVLTSCGLGDTVYVSTGSENKMKKRLVRYNSYVAFEELTTLNAKICTYILGRDCSRVAVRIDCSELPPDFYLLE